MLVSATLELLALLAAVCEGVAECIVVVVPVVVSVVFVVGGVMSVFGTYPAGALVDIDIDMEDSVAGPEAGVGRVPAPPAYAWQMFGSGVGGLNVSPLAVKAETQMPLEIVRVSGLDPSAPALMWCNWSLLTDQLLLRASTRAHARDQRLHDIFCSGCAKTVSVCNRRAGASRSCCRDETLQSTLWYFADIEAT